MSTTTRTLIGFLVLIAAAFYFLLGKLIERVERQYLEAAEEPMVDTANIIASLLAPEFEARDFTRTRAAFNEIGRRKIEARIYDVVKRSVDMNIYVTDSDGLVLFDSRNGFAEGQDFRRFNDVHRTLRGEYGARSTRLDEEDEASSVMHVGAPILRGGEVVGMVSVFKPQASMFGFIAQTNRRIIYYGWSILLATMLAAVLVSHWFSGPVRRLTEYARAVRRGERTALPRLNGPDVRMLGTALEEMRDSLEDRKYVESYVQTVTHELKSPVAAIRGAAELLQEGAMPADRRKRFLENIRIETERLQSIIDRFLALSSIESMKALENPSEIDLTRLLEELCASHQSALERRRIQLNREFPDRFVVRGEAFLLEMAIANLLQNAIDFSPEKGRISVGLKRHPANGTVEVIIENDGPEIPDYAMGKVFDRFYSLRHPSTGRKSSGLGLCFVWECAELHGGTAKLENRAGAAGVRAILSLPLLETG